MDLLRSLEQAIVMALTRVHQLGDVKVNVEGTTLYITGILMVGGFPKQVSIEVKV